MQQCENTPLQTPMRLLLKGQRGDPAAENLQKRYYKVAVFLNDCLTGGAPQPVNLRITVRTV